MEESDPIEIFVSAIPDEIDIVDLEIKANDCFKNAYNVAKKYPTVKVIEGVIFLRTIDNKGKALPHAWNKRGDINFDITATQAWVSSELSGVNSVRYFFEQEFGIEKLESLQLLDFAEKTKKEAADLNSLF